VTILRRILLVVLLLAAAPFAHAAGPTLLFDPATEDVLSQDRAGEPWYPASLTKLMTAYVVFQKMKSGQLSLEQKIPVSELAHSQPPSKIGVPVGKTVSVDFALQALLVHSANDMAYVLAEAASGTVSNFAADMNAQARKLGMTGSHFVNPNGLFDQRHISTARDIAILASALLREFPEHTHYYEQDTLPVGKRKLANRNALLRQMPEADGMKTGFVCNSGFNLVASATRDGRRLIAVVLGAPNSGSRAEVARALLTDGFSKGTLPSRPRLAQISDNPLGAIVPADMTTTVCKKKPPVSPVRAKELSGWGISFGNYDTLQKADMALRGRLISPAGMDAPGKVGVVRMPNKGGFAAMIWNIDQPTSQALCTDYRSQNAACEVITPVAFAQIAALSKEPEPKPKKQAPVAQGSDAQKIDTKKPVKKTAN
jgi:D-alanyl-D-alanine carboxypeptidase